MPRREPGRRARQSSITIPEKVSPHIRLVFEEMKRQGVTYEQLEAGSGVLKATTKAWRHRNKPSLESIEAVFGYLGWDFVPIPRGDRLPSQIAERLRPVADALGMSMDRATQVLIEIVADIHVKAGAQRATKPKPLVEAVPPKRRRGEPHPDQGGLLLH